MKSNWREIPKPCRTSRSKLVALVAIAFYFLIARTATPRFHKLLMLQHLGENGRLYYKLLQEIPDRLDVRELGREISSGLRAFCKEISWKIGGRKISEYQGERLSTLFEWLARICRRETRNWIVVCLQKVANETCIEKYNAFFYLTHCSHEKVDSLVLSMIERNALSKTWQTQDLEVKYYPATSGYICHLDLGYQL